jgi:hypothetical protein
MRIGRKTEAFGEKSQHTVTLFTTNPTRPTWDQTGTAADQSKKDRSYADSIKTVSENLWALNIRFHFSTPVVAAPYILYFELKCGSEDFCLLGYNAV